MLGYASITTTERYLEPLRSLQSTAGDFIQIELALAPRYNSAHKRFLNPSQPKGVITLSITARVKFPSWLHW